MPKLNWESHPTVLSNSQITSLVAGLQYPIQLTSATSTEESARNDARYDIITGDPLDHWLVDSPTYCNPSELEAKFSVLQALKQDIPRSLRSLPFTSGILAYLSYNVGERMMGVLKNSGGGFDFPQAFAGYYTWSYVFDRHTQSGEIVFSPRCNEALRKKIIALINENNLNIHSSSRMTPWCKSQTKAEYLSQFKKIKRYIEAGDIYQANLTQRFESHFEGNVHFYFSETARAISNPYSAFLSLGPEQQIMCFSPEQFIAIDQRHISTRPIKGTVAAESGDMGAKALQKSEKNRAENLMIVDLMRNDLSRHCEPHSVHVPKLFTLERFRNVYHLVSTVTGKLSADTNPIKALIDCFPGGSITGAPKKRAMEIIAELELSERSAYCGTIFYLGDHGRLDSNIMIRTVVRSGDDLYCWAGGGIVADSDAEEEYMESLTKVNNIVSFGET